MEDGILQLWRQEDRLKEHISGAWQSGRQRRQCLIWTAWDWRTVEIGITGALESRGHAVTVSISGGGHTWSSGGRRTVSIEWRRLYLELWRQEDSVSRLEVSIPGALKAVGQCQ